MWSQDEDNTATDSDQESCLSSEDGGDIQCEILEKQRDEANHRLTELEDVSNQLLKEINVLEIQFQIERSCRESAEALALKVSKENKVLKRRSQMMLPLIPELPDNLAAVTLDPEIDSMNDGDVVDGGKDNSENALLLESQAKITALQASVDGLLAEKLQLEQQVEEMTREQVQLREQLALEVEEKEAILKKMSKQSKTMNKIKRVSQLVTEEFTEISQKLELEQGLRQHAEVFAHQMLVEQKADKRQSMMENRQNRDAGMQLQLQQALEQISHISTVLHDMQLHYQDQVKHSKEATEDNSVLFELQNVKEKLEKSEEGRKTLETQLSEANTSVTQLQDEVRQLQEQLSREDEINELGEESTSAPAPPPPPPPPPPTPVINLHNFLKSRKKDGVSAADQNKSAPLSNMKAKAVDEMMERIKKGIILRPIKRIQEDDSSWKDQKSENRKSAILELKGMLDNIKRHNHRRVPSRRGHGRNVGEAELLSVLQKRRRAMGENNDQIPSTQGQQCVPAADDGPWAGESGSSPVLRRLKQNREKRDSRIRASVLILNNQA